MEAKQHTSKYPINHGRNLKKEIKMCIEANENENMTAQTCGI